MFGLNHIAKEIRHMTATLNDIKALADDLKTKSDSIIQDLADAKTGIASLQAKLDAALANADDPAAVQAIKDELQGIDDAVTSATETATAPPPVIPVDPGTPSSTP